MRSWVRLYFSAFAVILGSFYQQIQPGIVIRWQKLPRGENMISLPIQLLNDDLYQTGLRKLQETDWHCLTRIWGNLVAIYDKILVEGIEDQSFLLYWVWKHIAYCWQKRARVEANENVRRPQKRKAVMDIMFSVPYSLWCHDQGFCFVLILH